MTNHTRYSIACIGLSESTAAVFENIFNPNLKFFFFKSGIEFYTGASNQTFNAIVSEGSISGSFGLPLKTALNNSGFRHVPFSIIVDEMHPSSIKTVMQEGVAEIFVKPLSPEIVSRKLKFLIELKLLNKEENHLNYEYKIPMGKRCFDIAISSLALLALSPLFLILAALVRLESKGPVFYYSLRVGTGYKIFRFYKFRSMFVGADARLSQLKHLNQYNAADTATAGEKVRQKCAECELTGRECHVPLYADDKKYCEKLYKSEQTEKADQAFIKIKDDPRVTRIGKYLRNLSLDELPQLWNVLKGDMSLVGNRPLPLYEAEKLTTDKYALRFIAPAGITGLWQVSKRGGKGEMSEDERISLDNDYAKSYGLVFDIKLIFRTIPALFQKENV